MPSKKDSRLWILASNIIKCIVQCISKIWLETLNTTKVVNKETFLILTKSREPGRGLVTVSNHHSYLDDPLLWGISPFTWKKGFRPWSNLLSLGSPCRWVPAAKEICFYSRATTLFFTLGQCIPVVRGDGVYQEGMDQILDKVNTGQWVHMFPEGLVNVTKERMRLKWGVGRIIAEADVTPIVLPFYHLGLDTILPIQPPHWPRLGKIVTIVIGEPIDYTEEVTRMKTQMSKEEIRKAITDDIEEKVYQLKQEAERVHFPRIGLTSPIGVLSTVDELSAASGTDVTSQPSNGR
ncbi:tafazzin-like isoform X1 [Dreissena polymorpha]|uniref:tafazzin-like isoform X1 n=1 Tax=Dreissena polymorpha TaxID=45954 RepID=UPI002264770B|nr:tafazzin-like isoform X1 [Dreissena polymorpha]